MPSEKPTAPRISVKSLRELKRKALLDKIKQENKEKS